MYVIFDETLFLQIPFIVPLLFLATCLIRSIIKAYVYNIQRSLILKFLLMFNMFIRGYTVLDFFFLGGGGVPLLTPNPPPPLGSPKILFLGWTPCPPFFACQRGWWCMMDTPTPRLETWPKNFEEGGKKCLTYHVMHAMLPPPPPLKTSCIHYTVEVCKPHKFCLQRSHPLYSWRRVINEGWIPECRALDNLQEERH